MEPFRNAGPRIIVILLLSCNIGLSQPTDTEPEYWPTAGWRTSLPERQGVDSEGLAEMVETVHEEGRHIRGIVLVRNGYVILDASFHPFPGDCPHIIQSCTKSITSALIGIAIDRGSIKGVDRPVLEFFPDLSPRNNDGRKKTLTLHHLLTMSAGLDTRDSYLYGWEGLRKMTASDDWVSHVLDLPLAAPPGGRFEYSNGVSYLLTAILQRATGMDALAFAGKNLLGPLGIGTIAWPKSPQGINLGWTGIRMKPLDLARIGYLYLNSGKWEGKQIVSRNWIETSTRKQIHAGTLTEAYGYQWWIENGGTFAALGSGGQYLIVCPRHNVVVVFASALESKDFGIPNLLFNTFILPACRSSSPLPENPAGAARLRKIVTAVANPQPSPVSPLPAMAMAVSGRTYDFEPVPGPFRTISLTFGEGRDEASLGLAFGPKHIDVAVGLDNVYRLTREEGYLRAYRGLWEDDSTFAMSYQVVDFTERGSLRVTFRDDTLRAVIRDDIAGERHELTGKYRK